MATHVPSPSQGVAFNFGYFDVLESRAVGGESREEDVMRRGLYLILLSWLSLQVVASEDRRPIPAQAARGRELFLQSPKGTACGTCHAMAGIGTAVGRI